MPGSGPLPLSCLRIAGIKQILIPPPLTWSNKLAGDWRDLCIGSLFECRPPDASLGAGTPAERR